MLAVWGDYSINRNCRSFYSLIVNSCDKITTKQNIFVFCGKCIRRSDYWLLQDSIPQSPSLWTNTQPFSLTGKMVSLAKSLSVYLWTKRLSVRILLQLLNSRYRAYQRQSVLAIRVKIHSIQIRDMTKTLSSSYYFKDTLKVYFW